MPRLASWELPSPRARTVRTSDDARKPCFRFILSLFFAFIFSASLGFAEDSNPPPLPNPLIPVVLKVDDLIAGDPVPPRWKRIIDFALERKIKLSIGVIANSLATDKPSYAAYLLELKKTGLIEFWFHGYAHSVRMIKGKMYPEFASRTYEEQKALFDSSQKLAVEKLGAAFVTYGPPGGGNTPSSVADLEATAHVMTTDPAMKIWLYPTAIDDIGRKLEAAGKVTVLDRVWQVNIEQPIFAPNPAKLISGYTKYAPGRRYFILQGHPNQWSDTGWADFVKLVDYLQQNHIPIVTPTELVASLPKS